MNTPAFPSRSFYLLWPVLLISLLLSGCIFVAGAAAGAAGVAVVYDHRHLEKILQDQKIAHQIAKRLQTSPALAHSVSVTSFNQIVLLTGEVPSPLLQQQAGHMAAGVPDVKRVYNQISVRGPVSSLTRASDTWITAKIKTEMLATKDLASGTIKVVTENGSVYLMGIVSREQASKAVDIARRVSGVQRVIRIFAYLPAK